MSGVAIENMSTAFWAAEAEAVRQSLAQTTDFRIFPLLAETVLWGTHSSACDAAIPVTHDSITAIFTVLIATSTYILLYVSSLLTLSFWIPT